jgi:hypothetical protein
VNTLHITKADLNERNEYKGASVSAAGHIEIAANLGCVKFHGSVTAAGRIRALAGSGIEAGWGINAGWGIEAGSGIKAGSGIEAGLSITCGSSLAVKLRIFAGMCMWRRPEQYEMEIRAKQVDGEVCHGTVRLLNSETEETA